MIRRNICLFLALMLMGGLIFWITQPRDPSQSGEPESGSEPTPTLPKPRPATAVAAIKAENSLLLGTGGERGDALDRFWESSVTTILPSLVSVQAYRIDKKQVTAGLAGTGVFVSADGHLLCSQVLARDAAALRVRLADGTVEAARVLALDHSLGLALLQIQRSETKAVQWARPSVHERADRFLVAGRAASGAEWYASALLASAATSGPVGESSPPADRLLVFDAPVSDGKGAVVADRRGYAVGLVRIEEVPGSQPRFLVMPSHYVDASVKQMIRLGRPALAQLGATVQSLDRDSARSLGLEKPGGALVSDVLPGLAAGAAGIEPGDVILGAGGFRVGNPQDLRAIMAQAPMEQPLPVELWRKGETRTIVVTPTSAQAPYSSDAGTVDPFPGESILKALSVRPAGNGGLEIAEFRPDQVIAGASLLPGDLLLEVEGEPVQLPEDFNRILEATRDRDVLRLRVDNGGVRRFLTLKRL